jgi:hypothetical protein
MMGVASGNADGQYIALPVNTAQLSDHDVDSISDTAIEQQEDKLKEQPPSLQRQRQQGGPPGRRQTHPTTSAARDPDAIRKKIRGFFFPKNLAKVFAFPLLTVEWPSLLHEIPGASI